MLKSVLRILGRQHWLRFGLRDRLIRRFYAPEKNPAEGFVCDFFGDQYSGQIDSYVDWCVYFYGAYELENLQLFADILSKQKDPIVLDIGANVGHHSLFLSRHSREVHSFEPNPFVRKKLEEKIALNHKENMRVHPYGLGQKNEDLPFFAPQGCNKGTGSFVEGFSQNNELAGELKVLRADEYVEKLNLPQIDFIKIDVEGFEKNVLSGLVSVFEKHRPVVIVEFSEATMKSYESEAEFREQFPADYEFFKVCAGESYLGLFNRHGYRLETLNFAVSGGDILCRPKA